MIKMIFTLRNDLSLCRLCYEQDDEIKEVKAVDIYIYFQIEQITFMTFLSLTLQLG